MVGLEALACEMGSVGLEVMGCEMGSVGLEVMAWRNGFDVCLGVLFWRSESGDGVMGAKSKYLII